MRILFSPIGTADPITQLGDGPMLHIVRHYEPELVVLFLSPKMTGHQRADGRYTRAIELLCEAENRPVPDIRLVESTYDDVFRFDYYIEEFEHIIRGLCEQSSDAPVLVNASSGTPAMEQSLVALGSFGRLRLRVLQVPTPRRDANRNDDREDPGNYDLDAMWEYNEALRVDDQDARKSRVIEVATPNFAERLIRENVISLVRGYDYEAAYTLARDMRSINPNVLRLIGAARDRLNLDVSPSTGVFRNPELAFRANDLLGEHLAVMEVRLAQGHWADFVRLISPALMQASKSELEKNGLPQRAYMTMENGKPTESPNWHAIEGDDRLARVFGTRRSGFHRTSYISAAQIASLVEEYCREGNAKTMLRRLRTVEEKCRNKLAHQLRASSKQSLERLGGMKLETVLKYLFELHGDARPHLYAGINDAIISQL